MSNYVMSVDFFGNTVRAETEGTMVSLTDLTRAGNMWRIQNNLPPKTVQSVIQTQGFIEFVEVVKKDNPNQEVLKVQGAGGTKRTMAHIIIAIYFAEQFSPVFHYNVIKTFVEGKLLEFREQGGTEFKTLNAAIDLYLPDRQDKDNKGIYIQTAIKLREKLLGKGAEAGGWDSASVAQIHNRYECESYLTKTLRLGMVRDWDHLKELIEKV
jgi:hypothetical protein